jgi:hypothetical protein
MPEPTVREMLVAKIDELVAMTTRDLDEIRPVVEQLEPDRARSCRNAITSVGDGRRDPPAGSRPSARRGRLMITGHSGAVRLSSNPVGAGARIQAGGQGCLPADGSGGSSASRAGARAGFHPAATARRGKPAEPPRRLRAGPASPCRGRSGVRSSGDCQGLTSSSCWSTSAWWSTASRSWWSCWSASWSAVWSGWWSAAWSGWWSAVVACSSRRRCG